METAVNKARIRCAFILAQNPTSEEQKQFGIKIIKFPTTTYNEMDDQANNEQRQEIRNYILAFLNE